MMAVLFVAVPLGLNTMILCRMQQQWIAVQRFLEAQP
jgi:hypothetical protein